MSLDNALLILGVKVDQANGDVGAIGFMAGFLGEAACGNVEPAVWC